MLGTSGLGGPTSFELRTGADDTLKAGYVWVMDIGMYSNYITGAAGDYMQSQAAIAVDTWQNNYHWLPDNEVFVYSNLTAGAETNVYATVAQTNEGYDSGLKNAAEGTIYTADANALRGQVVNTSVMLRVNADGSMTWAADQSGNRIQKSTPYYAPAAGNPSQASAPSKLTYLNFQEITKGTYGGDTNVDVLNLTTGTVAKANTFVASTLKVGVTSLKLQQVSNADFNADGIIDIVNGETGDGDGLRLINGLEMFPVSGATFFDGDSTGDGKVDIVDGETGEGDAMNFLNALGEDTAAAATAHVHYDFATGIITLDATTVKIFNILSATDKLVDSSAQSLGLTLTHSAHQFSWLSLSNWSTTAGGQVIGSVVVGTPSSDLSFKYKSGTVLVPGTITTINEPEPATMALLVMGGLGILARRRHAA
jgi:hypothetical protein